MARINVAKDGVFYAINEEDLPEAQAQGWNPVTPQEQAKISALSDLGTVAGTAGLAAARGATLGLSDPLLTKLTPLTPEDIRQKKEALPELSGGVETLGSILTFGPKGLVGGATRAVGRGLGKTVLGKLPRTAQLAARGGTEALAVGAGQEISRGTLQEETASEIAEAIQNRAMGDLLTGAAIDVGLGKIAKTGARAIEAVGQKGEQYGESLFALARVPRKQLKKYQRRGAAPRLERELEAVYEPGMTPQRMEEKLFAATEKADSALRTQKNALSKVENSLAPEELRIQAIDKVEKDILDYLDEGYSSAGNESLQRRFVAAEKEISPFLTNLRRSAGKKNVVDQLWKQRTELKPLFKKTAPGEAKEHREELREIYNILNRNIDDYAAALSDTAGKPALYKSYKLANQKMSDLLGLSMFSEKIAYGTRFPTALAEGVTDLIPSGLRGAALGGTAGAAFGGPIGAGVGAIAGFGGFKGAARKTAELMGSPERAVPIIRELSEKGKVGSFIKKSGQVMEQVGSSDLGRGAAIKLAVSDEESKKAAERVQKLQMDPMKFSAAIQQAAALGGGEGGDDALLRATESIRFLQEVAPKVDAPGAEPDRQQIREFAKYVHAVKNPISVIEAANRGIVSPEGAEVLQRLYPNMVRQLTEKLAELTPAEIKKIPYKKRLALSMLLGIGVGQTGSPAQTSQIQASYNRSEQQQKPKRSSFGQVDLAEGAASPSLAVQERRSMR